MNNKSGYAKNNISKEMRALPMISRRSTSMDIPLGLSMAMAQNPSVLSIFESLDNSELRALAGIRNEAATDMNGRVNGLYDAADSFGRIRMF